ncbi:uncharacterized protein LOC143029943 [Oratosquilla oratoria]|uniref:uncharacterized protein LOC143029943 n=1 Tax=Oratosquilla oratoria TaxID=337810 RepID=UPI003F76F3DB
MKRATKKKIRKRKTVRVQKCALMLELVDIAVITNGEVNILRIAQYEQFYIENRRTVTITESEIANEFCADANGRTSRVGKTLKRPRKESVESVGALTRRYRRSSLRQKSSLKESGEWVEASVEDSRSFWKTRAMAGKGIARRDHHAVFLALAPFFFLLHVSAAVTAHARSPLKPQSPPSSQPPLHHHAGPSFRPSPATHSASSSSSSSSTNSHHSTSSTANVPLPFNRPHIHHPFHYHQTIPSSHIIRPPHLLSTTTHEFTPHEDTSSFHHPRTIHTPPQHRGTILSTVSLRIISFTKLCASRLRDSIKQNTNQRKTKSDYKDKGTEDDVPTNKKSIDETSTDDKHPFYKDDRMEKYNDGRKDNICEGMEHCAEKSSAITLQTKNDVSGNNEQRFKRGNAISKSITHSKDINKNHVRLNIERKQMKRGRSENSDLHKNIKDFREDKNHNIDLRNKRANFIKPVTFLKPVTAQLRSSTEVASSFISLPHDVPPQGWTRKVLDPLGSVLKVNPSHDSTHDRDLTKGVSENMPALQEADNNTPRYKYVSKINGDITSSPMGTVRIRKSRKRSADSEEFFLNDVSDGGKYSNIRLSLRTKFDPKIRGDIKKRRATLGCVSCNNNHRIQGKEHKELVINEGSGNGGYREGPIDATRNVVGNNNTHREPGETNPMKQELTEDSNFSTRDKTKRTGGLSREGSPVSRIRNISRGRERRDRSTINDISSNGKNRNDSDTSEGWRKVRERWWKEARASGIRKSKAETKVIRREPNVDKGGGSIGVQGGASDEKKRLDYHDRRKAKRDKARKIWRRKNIDLNVRMSERAKIYNSTGDAGSRNASESVFVGNSKNEKNVIHQASERVRIYNNTDDSENRNYTKSVFVRDSKKEKNVVNYMNHKNKTRNILVTEELRKKRSNRTNKTSDFMLTIMNKTENVNRYELQRASNIEGDQFGSDNSITENNTFISHTPRNGNSDISVKSRPSEIIRTKRKNSDMYIHISSNSDREGSEMVAENENNITCVPQNPQCKAPSTCWATSADPPLTCSRKYRDLL